MASSSRQTRIRSKSYQQSWAELAEVAKTNQATKQINIQVELKIMDEFRLIKWPYTKAISTP